MEVRCKLHATCEKECGAKKPHDDSSCEPCPFNKVAKCIEYTPPGAQDFMLSEAEEQMQVPGPAAAR